MILEQIVKASQKRVRALKKEGKILKGQLRPDPFCFEKALAGAEMAFICEVKKASPSKGVIAADFPYLDIARDYQKAGATCISVVTEPEFFLGDNAYLSEISKVVKIPILRKDFIIDPIQIHEASLIGADAILLICSILTKEEIKSYIKQADALGLSTLVEAHNEEEVNKALSGQARIIGVNNRNLKTFEVDLNNSIKLRKKVPDDIVFVSESGIRTRSDIKKLRENKTNAVLIGESLMRSGDKKAGLKKLRAD